MRGDLYTLVRSACPSGLSIVHQIVTTMGGTVSVKSEKGVGSVFTVTSPWDVCTENEHAAQPEAIKVSSPLQTSSSKSAHSPQHLGLSPRAQQAAFSPRAQQAALSPRGQQAGLSPRSHHSALSPHARTKPRFLVVDGKCDIDMFESSCSISFACLSLAVYVWLNACVCGCLDSV